jgi:hypothetical protein
MTTRNDRRKAKSARRAAEAEAHAREIEEEEIEDLEAEFWNAPRGQARSAKLAGDRYVQIKLSLDWADLHGAGDDVEMRVRGGNAQGRTLTEIEDEGWVLLHAGFVHNSRTGVNSGVYIFGATTDPPRTDEVWLDWLGGG